VSGGSERTGGVAAVNVLVACEFSGVVRDAFRARGHDAWSCDLLPSERAGPHLQGDVRQFLVPGWDLMVAHPPCIYLCSSGARWWTARRQEQEEAVSFFLALARAPIPRIALENPIGILSTLLRPADQIVQPWQHGHPETKATCLWLKDLLPLQPTNIVEGREPRVHWEPPSPNRQKNRSRTYEGIAKAMAEQWG
jgi:hypothetical protein